MRKFLNLYKNNSRLSLPGDLMPFILLGATALILVFALLRFYILTTRPVINLGDRQRSFFYIRTGSGFSAVKKSLVRKGYLSDPVAFEWLSRRKNYIHKIRAGRYLLQNGMHNNVLVNLLRSGKQEPVRITIQNTRTREELAGKLGKQLETDSLKLMQFFNCSPMLDIYYGITPATLLTLFIPNTYEFYWNTSAYQLLNRMHSEFGRFWTPLRRYKADSLHLTIPEIVTMASIVEKETNKNDEKPVIAGVYINRLKKKIPLQADPTVVYAWNDYSIRRILKTHTQIKSLYNTYYHPGLPPGPICIPSIASVDAVLHAMDHRYLYFCAREDFSGYHIFAASLDEHNRNARKYRLALDKLNIK